MDIIKVVAGFILLLLSGKYLVNSAVSLAQHLKVSRLVIGVTVVSFGTSVPELLVSLQAAFNGHPDIAMGNVVGSNISNIALVLAVSALIFPIPVRSNSIKIDWPIMIIASILLYVFSLNMNVSRSEGIILVIMLLAFVYYTVSRSRKKDQHLILEEKVEKNLSIPQTFLIMIPSLIGLYFGSEWLVEGAANIATRFGVDERVISITLIAFGTSVPELATSGIAAFRKETDISIGNIIGSNIFNILGVIGITSASANLPIENKNLVGFDMYWMLGFSLALFFLILPLKGGILTRFKGGFLLLGYIVYLYFLL